MFAQFRSQPEFTEQIWQYINRRCSDWRVITGKERAKEYAGLLTRLEKDYGVDRYILLGLWGMELSFGDVVTNPKYMRPVIPALAALAWGEPRRRSYWEAELLNALTIVDHGWAQPSDMIGSWAGAMGHTQWMPEVWLHMGVDFDRDGRITPFGKPDDLLAGTARYLVERGGYRRGEAWGYEVKVSGRELGGWRTYEQWQKLGVARADGEPFRASRRPREIVGAGARRPRVPDRAEFPRGLFLQSLHQLHASALPSRRPRSAAIRRSTGSSPAASARRRWPKSRKSSAASTSRASRPTASMAAPAATRSRPFWRSRRRSACSPPTAMPD